MQNGTSDAIKRTRAETGRDQLKAVVDSATGETQLSGGMDNARTAQSSTVGDGPVTKLTARQERLLAILVSNPDIRAASKAARVGRTTAHRWLRQPAFRDELARQRDAVLSEALRTVQAYATRAAHELAKLLGTSDERLRRQICNDILNHAMKVRELEDIERRLALLEKSMQNNRERSRQ